MKEEKEETTTELIQKPPEVYIKLSTLQDLRYIQKIL
jgi:hypothetical protein